MYHIGFLPVSNMQIFTHWFWDMPHRFFHLTAEKPPVVESTYYLLTVIIMTHWQMQTYSALKKYIDDIYWVK